MEVVEWKGRTRGLWISFSAQQLPCACTAGFSSTCIGTLLLMPVEPWLAEEMPFCCYTGCFSTFGTTGKQPGGINSASAARKHSGISVFLLNLNTMAKSVCPETRLAVQVALGCLSVWLQKTDESLLCKLGQVYPCLCCHGAGMGYTARRANVTHYKMNSKWHLNKYLCKMTPEDFQIRFVVCS